MFPPKTSDIACKCGICLTSITKYPAPVTHPSFPTLPSTVHILNTPVHGRRVSLSFAGQRGSPPYSGLRKPMLLLEGETRAHVTHRC